MTTLDIYALWQAVMSEVNVQQNGQIRPVTDFTAWLNKTNDKMFRDRVASDELAQLYADDLVPFKKRVNVSVIAQSGMPYDLVPYPDDYEFFANMFILRQKDGTTCACDKTLPLYESKDGKCQQVVDPDYAAMEARYLGMNLTEVTVTKVDTGRWGSCLEHDTEGPTYDKPKTTQNSTGLFIAPKGLTTVVLDYYRTPRPAIFGYTISSQDIVIYDPLTSVQLEWSNTLQGQFIDEMKKIYSIRVNDTSTYQMTKDSSSNSV